MAKKASASVPELATFNAAKKKADDLAKQLKDAADALREKGSSAATAKDFKALADAIGKLKQLRQTVPSAAQALRDATDAAHTALDAYIASLADKAGKDAQTAPDALSPLPPGVFPDTIAGSGMKVVNADPGGTTGAQIVEIDGRRYVFKTAGKVSAEHVRNEAAADQAYRRAGIRVPDCRIYEEDGKTYKLSEFIDGGQSLGDYLAKATPEQRKAALDQLAQGYPLDALFGNRDAYGTSRGAWHGHDFDNILVDKDGNVWRIDNGSAFGFRAQGAKKDAKDWEKREWPDEWRTLREYNPDLFGKLDAHAIFTNFNRLDVDAALKDLPDDVKKALEKPLAEMRQLGARCANFDVGGYTPETTSLVLETTYDLSKESFREEVPKHISYGHYGYCRNSGLAGHQNPGGLPDYSSIIKTAAISINKHAGYGKGAADYTPNTFSVKAALDLKADLQKYAKTDSNAQTLLGILGEIEKAKDANWHIGQQISNVPDLTVTPPDVKAAASRKYKSLTEHLFGYAEAKFGIDPKTKKPNIDPGEITSLYSAQGSHSWSGHGGTTCRLKILNLALRGENWESPSKDVFTGGPDYQSYYDTQVEFYKANPAQLEHDKKALCLWKSATQLLLENASFDGNHPEGRFIYSTRTDKKERFVGMVAGEVNPAHQIGGCESGSVLESIVSGCSGPWIGVRRIPYSRINALYFMDGSPTSGTMFLRDSEREVSSDLVGLPVYWTGEKGSGWDIAAHTPELDAAFDAWDKAHH